MAIDDKEWGELKQMVKDTRDDVIKIDKKLDKGFGLINDRVRKLEVWKGYMMGIGSLLVVAISLFMKYVL